MRSSIAPMAATLTRRLKFAVLSADKTVDAGRAAAFAVAVTGFSEAASRFVTLLRHLRKGERAPDAIGVMVDRTA